MKDESKNKMHPKRKRKIQFRFERKWNHQAVRSSFSTFVQGIEKDLTQHVKSDNYQGYLIGADRTVRRVRAILQSD